VENLNTLILLLGFMIMIAMMYSLCGTKSSAPASTGGTLLKGLFVLTKVKLLILTLIFALSAYISLSFKAQPSGFTITVNDKAVIDARLAKLKYFANSSLEGVKNLLP
jgi:hypothetical protein